MKRHAIEQEARRLQFEVWSRRALLWPLGVPRIESLFEPPMVARVLGLEYEFKDFIERAPNASTSLEAAGYLDRSNEVIAVSTRFQFVTQRFTGAHEIGHFVLHPFVGERFVHRDRAVHGLQLTGRPQIEQEADYFAACLLVPLKPLLVAFELRFGTRKPLPLNETVAFHLAGGSAHQLFTSPGRSLEFASAVARAESFDRQRFTSLAALFGVSVSAMAVRLREAGLVVD